MWGEVGFPTAVGAKLGMQQREHPFTCCRIRWKSERMCEEERHGRIQSSPFLCLLIVLDNHMRGSRRRGQRGERREERYEGREERGRGERGRGDRGAGGRMRVRMRDS